jgi:hypothetical protein
MLLLLLLLLLLTMMMPPPPSHRTLRPRKVDLRPRGGSRSSNDDGHATGRRCRIRSRRSVGTRNRLFGVLSTGHSQHTETYRRRTVPLLAVLRLRLVGVRPKAPSRPSAHADEVARANGAMPAGRELGFPRPSPIPS